MLEDIGPINLKSLKIALECHYSLWLWIHCLRLFIRIISRQR